jgi:hypothetical protein
MDKAPSTLNIFLPLDPKKRIEKSYKVDKKPVRLILTKKDEGPYSIQVIVTSKEKYTPLFSATVGSEKELNELWRACLKNIKARA